MRDSVKKYILEFLEAMGEVQDKVHDDPVASRNMDTLAQYIDKIDSPADLADKFDRAMNLTTFQFDKEMEEYNNA